MTTMLDSVEEVLEWLGMTWERLDGSTKASERGTILSKYSSSVDVSRQLLSKFAECKSIQHSLNVKPMLMTWRSGYAFLTFLMLGMFMTYCDCRTLSIALHTQLPATSTFLLIVLHFLTSSICNACRSL
jgi:hypothetical protein